MYLYGALISCTCIISQGNIVFKLTICTLWSIRYLYTSTVYACLLSFISIWTCCITAWLDNHVSIGLYIKESFHGIQDIYIWHQTKTSMHGNKITMHSHAMFYICIEFSTCIIDNSIWSTSKWVYISVPIHIRVIWTVSVLQYTWMTRTENNEHFFQNYILLVYMDYMRICH